MKLNGKNQFVNGLTPTILGVLLFYFISPASANANDTMKNNILVLSTGNELIECLFQNGRFKINGQPLLDKNWQNAVWPNFNRKTGRVYFEAKNADFGSAPHIFAFSFPGEQPVPELITEGRYPSLSPDGLLLAYYRHPSQLWIFDIKRKKSTKFISDYAKRNPAVWISDKEIVYNDTANHLCRISVLSGVKDDTGLQKIIPGSLSPDGEKVLCGSYDGKKIYLYSIKTNTLKVLKKSLFLSMGSSFIWSPDSHHFFFTRQTLSNQIKMKESRSLFYSSQEKEEQKLVDVFSLFGGFFN